MTASVKVFLMVVSLVVVAPSALAQAVAPAPLGALTPANLAKQRPKAPFDLTGTWMHDNKDGPNSWRFVPPTFKLTPQAQEHYDAGQKATREGKVYRDDIGQCWPAGMPLIMTRVWPIAMIQLPTAIYMTSAFMNGLRIIYLDGRPHSDPDIVVPSFNGESIGRWEGSTLSCRHKILSGSPPLDGPGRRFHSGKRSAPYHRTHAHDQQRERPGNRIHDDRSEELGRRMEDDETMESGE